MVCLSRVAAALTTLVTLCAASAQAADMPRLPPAIPVQPVAPVQWLSSGWYLRGDFGYRFGASVRGDSPAPVPDATSNDIGNGFVGGAGFGIKTRWLRTDVTLDYGSPQKYTGTVAAPNDTTAKIQANTALFNGYFDLGTWYRITPYIGGGLGTSYVRVTDYQSTGSPPFGGNTNHDQWTFAWALMAGLGVPVTPNMTVDVGYRYLNVGDASARDTGAGAMIFRNVAGHEVRVGMRWSFDDLREYP
jgi:opacity protein-like surface antigen